MKNIYIDLSLPFHLLNFNPSATEPTNNNEQQLEDPPLKQLRRDLIFRLKQLIDIA